MRLIAKKIRTPTTITRASRIRCSESLRVFMVVLLAAALIYARLIKKHALCQR